MIAVDSTFLSLLLHPNAKPPTDPSTGQLVDRLDERIELLIEELTEDGETAIVPAPVLTEFLILAAEDGPQYLAEINATHFLRVESFDQKAAIELAAIHLEARRASSKRANKRSDAQGTWAKINFDRQIVAIAKVHGAHTIYSDDEDVEKFAKRAGISVVKMWELPLPQGTQNDLPFDAEAGETPEDKDGTEAGNQEKREAEGPKEAGG